MDFEKEIASLKAKITPMNTAKFIMGTLISIGAYTAVIGVMKSGLGGSKGVTKLLTKLGIFVLACKAGDSAKEYFIKTFEDTEKDFKEATEDIQKEAKDNGKNSD